MDIAEKMAAQAHKTLRNKVRQWLRDDKFDILKENE